MVRAHLDALPFTALTGRRTGQWTARLLFDAIKKAQTRKAEVLGELSARPVMIQRVMKAESYDSFASLYRLELQLLASESGGLEESVKAVEAFANRSRRYECPFACWLQDAVWAADDSCDLAFHLALRHGFTFSPLVPDTPRACFLCSATGPQVREEG